MLGQELWNLVATVGDSLVPGETTAQVGARLTEGLRAMGAESTYLTAGFPAAAAVSLTEEIANGIPSERKISDGDLVKLDTSVRRDGTFATAAWTFAIGRATGDPLLAAGQAALRAAIGQLRHGTRVGDVSAAIQGAIEGPGFRVLRELVGYAIIDEMPFQAPQLPCFGTAGTGKRLKLGTRFAVHVLATTSERTYCDNGWTWRGDPGTRGLGVSATVEVGDVAGRVIGCLPAFAQSMLR